MKLSNQLTNLIDAKTIHYDTLPRPSNLFLRRTISASFQLSLLLSRSLLSPPKISPLHAVISTKHVNFYIIFL